MKRPNKLSKQQQIAIETQAKALLGRRYRRKTFNCFHFVQAVYDQVEIYIPSHERNISLPVSDHMVGHVAFLRNPDSRRAYERNFTHCGIILPEGFIHCSLYFGKCVSISPFEEVFNFYELV